MKLYRPRLVVIEMHNFDLNRANENKIYVSLISSVHKMVGVLIMNGYFIDNLRPVAK